MSLYPLKLSYVTKSMIWGGTRLLDPACGWNQKSDFDKIGEAWKLTCRPKEMSTILNGANHGMTLGDYISTYGVGVLGQNFRGMTFPLLIKLIDATDKLSVQVHPDDAYAARIENGCGKTEMWYILEAEPGAELIYGLKEGVTKEDFCRAVEESRYDDVLHHQPVHAGETYFIPSGMVHAIGKGILLAEIQQNCDLTYRVYDYDRRQADGSLRQLHVEKAMAVTRPFTEDEINALRYEAATEEEKNDPTVLAHCKYFKTSVYTVDGTLEQISTPATFRNLLCLDGSGVIKFGSFSYPCVKGDNYFIPAGTGNYCLEGHFTFIEAALE